MKKGNKMSKMSNHVLELEEEFYISAQDIINDAESLDEALENIEILRSREYNWMDPYHVAQDTECAYYLK